MSGTSAPWPDRIVLASGNQGKLAEMRALLADLPIELIAQTSLQVPEAEETGSSFLENAILKARNAAKHTGLPAIADDSGLVVDALGGAPGVFSARYAGSGASDHDNLVKLLADSADVPADRRQCRFYCAIVYIRQPDDPCPEVSTGRWEGELAFIARGAHGFGYDPIFWLPDRHCTSAELPPDIKNAISHRGQALRGLALTLHDQGNVC